MRDDDSAFEVLRDEIEPLTIFAVAYRYPGPADPTIDEVTEARCAVTIVTKFTANRITRVSE